LPSKPIAGGAGPVEGPDLVDLNDGPLLLRQRPTVQGGQAIECLGRCADLLVGHVGGLETPLCSRKSAQGESDSPDKERHLEHRNVMYKQYWCLLLFLHIIVYLAVIKHKYLILKFCAVRVN
jgi:hypothetical protein